MRRPRFSCRHVGAIAVLCCVALLGFWANQPTFAQQASLGHTLERIKKTGEIRLGVWETETPFSYRLPDGRYVGYGIDYSEIIADTIRKKLAMPDLKIRPVSVTAANRILLLQNGLFDFECGSTTHSRTRAWLVGFSNTYFIVGTRLLVHRDSGIRDFPDLKGKRVALLHGTTSETMLETMNREKGMNLSLLSFPSSAEAFAAVQDGKADAWFLDDAMLAGERTTARNPSQWEIVGTPQSYEALACMVARNDPIFKKLLDDTISEIQRSGLGKQIYYKWFFLPIPPNNISLDFPLSGKMLDLFKEPNDKYFE